MWGGPPSGVWGLGSVAQQESLGICVGAALQLAPGNSGTVELHSWGAGLVCH